MNKLKRPLLLAAIMVFCFTVSMFGGMTVRQQLIFILFCLTFYLSIFVKRILRKRTDPVSQKSQRQKEEENEL